jgi:hypothetical protein
MLKYQAITQTYLLEDARTDRISTCHCNEHVRSGIVSLCCHNFKRCNFFATYRNILVKSLLISLFDLYEEQESVWHPLWGWFLTRNCTDPVSEVTLFAKANVFQALIERKAI